MMDLPRHDCEPFCGAIRPSQFGVCYRRSPTVRTPDVYGTFYPWHGTWSDRRTRTCTVSLNFVILCVDEV